MKKLLLASVTLMGIGLATQANAAPSVLIVAADSSPPIAELTATGDFATVDYFDATSGTPTLADLAGYTSRPRF